MSKCKSSLCLLLAALMAIMSLSTAFPAAAEDTAEAASPLTVQVEMSKSAYFVTAKAKATIRVQNNSSEMLKNVAISAFSENHLLPANSESGLLIPALEPGQTHAYSFEMVLDRTHAHVSFFERVLLFFAQLFRSCKPMQGIPLPDMMDNAVYTQEASFRHGSTNSVLQVQVWYNKGTDVSLDPADPVPRPQVTYLDKYVVDILSSGSYTTQMEMTEDGMTMQITTYVDGDDWASEIPIGSMMAQEMGLPSSLGVGTMRFIIKATTTNPKAYIVIPSGGYIEISDNTEITEIIKKVDEKDFSRQMQFEKLRYFGRTTGIGYVRESYILADENIRYDFYFTQTDNYTGLVRWDIYDLTTKEVIEQEVMRLYNGVTNKNAFKVSGQQLSYEEIETLYGITINDLYTLFG